MHRSILYFFILVFSLSSFAQGGSSRDSGGGGNGGDYIRMKFLEVGSFVLLNYKDGLQDINNVVRVEELREILNINLIKTSPKPLFDNRGSAVDAIGEFHSITLFAGDESRKTGWYGIFERGDLVEKLVLHEMLRSAGVNDDNYVYSNIVLNKYDAEKFNTDYYVKWCSETAGFVESALKQGIYSRTRAGEVKIYLDTLRRVESVISPKHFTFVRSLVLGSMLIEKSLVSESSKVNFLKLSLKQLAKDIKYIDKQLNSRKRNSTRDLGDNSGYAAEYIDSATQFLLLAETQEVESRILNIIFDQVFAYMVDSDYARTKYSGVFPEIDSAKYSRSLSYKRDALKYIKLLLTK